MSNNAPNAGAENLAAEWYARARRRSGPSRHARTGGLVNDLPDIFPEYAEKARLGVRKPPVDVSQRLADLLARRPDLAGLGVTYILEAVCA